MGEGMGGWGSFENHPLSLSNPNYCAGVNPLTAVKDLTAGHVSRVVKMNRDFSKVFYDCRKTGKPLHKFFKIYRFSTCKQCNGKVSSSRYIGAPPVNSAMERLVLQDL